MDVVYRFISTGAGDVEKAFEGIEKKARASKKATDDANKAGSKAASPARQRSKTTETDRAAAAEARAATRAASQRERAEDASHRRLLAGANRRHAERLRAVDQYAKSEARIMERARRAQAKDGGILGRIGSHAATAVTGVAIGATITAAAMALKAVKEASDLDDVARGFAISGRKPGQGFRDFAAIRRSIQDTAAGTPGVESAALARGLGSFQALTGETDFALKAQKTFATASSASGADPVAIAEAAASLFQHLDITGLEDMQEALAALHFQGKAGAIELENAADLFQSLAAAGKGAGLEGGLGGVKSLGGLLQIARGGTGSAAMAGHAVENIFRAMREKQTDLRAAGVNVYDSKTGKLTKPIEDLLAETVAKVGGTDMAKKQEQLSKIFGTEGGRGLAPLVGEFLEVFSKTGGSQAEKQKAAMEAVRQKLLEARNATGSYADMQTDAAMRQKAASAQITAAWEAIKLGVSDVALPALQSLADKLGPLGAELKKDFIDTTETMREGGAGEAAKAQATIDAINAKMVKAGIKSEGDLSQQDAYDLAQARGITGKFAAKQKAAADFKKTGGIVGTAPGALSRDQFIAQYAQAELDSKKSKYAELFGLGGAVGEAAGYGLEAMGFFNTPESDPAAVAAAQERAGGLFDQIQKTGGKPGGFFFGESAGAEAIRNRAQVQAGGEGTVEMRKNVELDTASAQTAINELASAATAAARAVRQGSVVDGGSVFAGR